MQDPKSLSLVASILLEEPVPIRLPDWDRRCHVARRGRSFRVLQAVGSGPDFRSVRFVLQTSSDPIAGASSYNAAEMGSRSVKRQKVDLDFYLRRVFQKKSFRYVSARPPTSDPEPELRQTI